MNLKIPRLNTKEKKNRRTDPAGNPASDAAPDDFSSGSYNPEEAEGAEHSRDAEAGTPERRVDTLQSVSFWSWSFSIMTTGDLPAGGNSRQVFMNR